MSYDLEELARKRNELLLAEVAAWLHDMGKCADEHISRQAHPPGAPDYKYKTTYSGLVSSSLTLTLLGESVPLRELIEKSMPRIIGRTSEPWVLRALGRCHAASHVEKELEDRAGAGKQPEYDTRPSSAFGHEGPALHGLTARLHGLPFASLADRAVFLKAVQGAFAVALGDTRRPENEVSLWDWCSTVAALYKAALAGALLGHQLDPDDFQWRLLSVRVDSMAFSGQANRIPDLLARRRLLNKAFDAVRVLLEETYPVATEVYRDEDNSLFVVPDLPELLDLVDRQGMSLQHRILAEFGQANIGGVARVPLEGEAIPSVQLDWQRWRGSTRGGLSEQDIPPVGRVLASPFVTRADPAFVSSSWRSISADICPVCGLRPQAPSHTQVSQRGVCRVCEQRRADRAQAWTTNLATTIWTDEVADVNGRLALLVGQFDLTHWLDGTLVETLLVTDPKDGGEAMRKTPSFARLRRIWETTRRFWQEVLPVEEGADLTQSVAGRTVRQVKGRLQLVPQAAQVSALGPYHAYDLVLSGACRLSVVWDAKNGRFITCDNLAYLAKKEQLGRAVAEVIRSGHTLTVEEPLGYGARNRVWGKITVEQICPLEGAYYPMIPILAEPRTFMALVPANRALEVVKAIKAKYELEMSKVRNRLPLTLGAVYFGRRTPLAAALEAGRRMLQPRGIGANGWEVRANDERTRAQAPSHLKASPHFESWREVRVRRGEREVRLCISTMMGDGKTCDPWYPYFFLEEAVPDTPLERRRRHLRARSPWSLDAELRPQEAGLVHVADLKPGDTVSFTPSTFDYEFLDTTARRFEVSYAAGKRRGADKAQRPYLLEELDDLERVWALLRPERVARAQIKALEALIEAKRRDWRQPRGAEALALPADAPFRRFCQDALATVAWRGRAWEKLAEEERTLLVDAAVSGMLADALELHLTLGKERDEEQN